MYWNRHMPPPLGSALRLSWFPHRRNGRRPPRVHGLVATSASIRRQPLSLDVVYSLH
jgi:hypothetical protein